MSWKENKEKTEWIEGDYKILKKPITERKSVFHVYKLDQYVAYCSSVEHAKDAAKKHKGK